MMRTQCRNIVSSPRTSGTSQTGKTNCHHSNYYFKGYNFCPTLVTLMSFGVFLQKNISTLSVEKKKFGGEV